MEFIAAARAFRQVLTGAGAAGGEDGPGDLKRLAAALDRLSLASHGTPETVPVPDVDAPDMGPGERETLVATIGRRFPALGPYPVVADRLDPDAGGQVVIGDARDDLMDIAAGIGDVLWLHDHAGPEAAAWTFRFGYEAH